MLNYFLKRLLGLIPTLLIVAVLVFLFVHLLCSAAKNFGLFRA